LLYLEGGSQRQKSAYLAQKRATPREAGRSDERHDPAKSVSVL
jgi:hypothetical protein